MPGDHAAFIHRENIKHFLSRLEAERDLQKRERIQQLLKAERLKLAQSIAEESASDNAKEPPG